MGAPGPGNLGRGQEGGYVAAEFPGADGPGGSSLVLAAGVTCSYFLFGQGRLDIAANSVTPGQTDPINNRYRYKLGKGLVTKTGESEFKQTMSFVPRNLA